MKAWAKGDRVSQATYGPGTLVEVNEHHTVIDFDEGGRRTFSTRLVTLAPTNEPAPAKAARKRATKAKAKDAAAGAGKDDVKVVKDVPGGPGGKDKKAKAAKA